jgi:NTE family protein
VGSTLLNNLSLNLLYLQPLTNRVFIRANAEFTRNQDDIVSGFLRQDLREQVMLSARGKIKMGIRFNNYNTLGAGPAIVFMGVPDAQPGASVFDIPGDNRKAALCFSTGYRFSSLDYQTFATRGFYAKLENTLLFPLPMDAGRMDDIVSLDISAAIPVGSSFSIITNFFAGTGINDTRFITLDRMYFPHLSENQRIGAHEAAASLILQYQPWKNLSILGGQILFSISASAGQITDEWRQFSLPDLIWNAAGSAGLRLGKTFGLRFQPGAGSSAAGRVEPFLAIDIGSFRY